MIARIVFRCRLPLIGRALAWLYNRELLEVDVDVYADGIENTTWSTDERLDLTIH